jgi:hypothetical protein
MFRKIFRLLGCLTLGLSPLPALAQAGDDEVRATVTINPDGSKTVDQKDGLSRRATATTTGADGKLLGRTTSKRPAAKDAHARRTPR